MSDSSNFSLPHDGANDGVPPIFGAAAVNQSSDDADTGAPGDESLPVAETGGPLADAAAEAARQLTHEHSPAAPAALTGATLPDGRPERRRKRRAMISAPVRVRGVDVTGGGPNEISTTMDVSRIGFHFLTGSTGYYRGMDVLVTFPYSSAASAVQAEQPGRVVRLTAMEDGRIGVAVSLAPVKHELVDAQGRRLGDGENAEPLVTLPPVDNGPKKPLVLLVDADPMIRMTLKTYLNADGYDVLAVQSADEAREVLNLRTPELLLAEIEGEGLPGFDLCAHVKTTPRLKQIPVVLMTSSAYPSDYSSAHSLGAVVCMAKPFKQERLGHVVRLLAPHPQAKADATPARPADPSRRAGGKGPKAKSAISGMRGYRILPNS
jgi:CheY-like chemotaxis protein